MSKYILFVAVIIFFTAVFSVLFKPYDMKSKNLSLRVNKDTVATQPKAIKARFMIFTRGLKRDFSSGRYHNLSKEVYIESNDPTTVNVKSEDVTWENFFMTLPMKVTKECLTTGTNQTFCNSKNEKLVFYLNGIKDEFLLNTVIVDGDEALISFGEESEEEIVKELNEF